MSQIPTCPRCQKGQLNQNNPFGLAVCPVCDWAGTLSGQPIDVWAQVKKLVKWITLCVLVIFFAAMSVQSILWKNYSFEVTYLQLRQLLGSDDNKTLVELGSICNSLEKYNCSVESFYQVVEHSPADRVALANLAIAYSNLGEWQKARPHFEAYFSLGGNGYDVMLWYGKALAQLEDAQRGVDWYYLALKENPNYMEAALILIQQLLNLNQPYEALSAIGAITDGWVDKFPVLDKKADDILDIITDKLARADVGEVRLPSLDGKTHYLPVRLSHKSRLSYFVVDPDFEGIVINQDFLDENLLSVPATANRKKVKLVGRTRDAKSFKVDELFIGPWRVQDVPVTFCSDCRLTLGRTGLSEIQLTAWKHHQISYFTLAKRTQPEGGTL